ncbi:hypothetical protein O3P69_004742 [Scylla paramamosain]|uniref:Uncharacterized protein n=1 Tax=Scylla paramamosain TaxID=85552 RepID=A0AAW0UBP8_SCYPA
MKRVGVKEDRRSNKENGIQRKRGVFGASPPPAPSPPPRPLDSTPGGASNNSPESSFFFFPSHVSILWPWPAAAPAAAPAAPAPPDASRCLPPAARPPTIR